MNAPEKLKQYDRDAQVVGNIVHLEHFNVVIDDQRLATLFYVVGLGGTRDPYLFPGLENMWVNFGRNQVHLPSRGSKPEVVRGTIGFVVPSLDDLKKRLEWAGKEMKRVVPEKQILVRTRVRAGTSGPILPDGLEGGGRRQRPSAILVLDHRWRGCGEQAITGRVGGGEGKGFPVLGLECQDPVLATGREVRGTKEAGILDNHVR